MAFISFANQITDLITTIVKSPQTHAKWLNTLSFLENCGARKIAAYEHPTLVREEVLKHAAEEFRHAHYLKSQISRVSHKELPNYMLEETLGGTKTLHYLKALDIRTCRYLANKGLSKLEIQQAAYLLVTYSIELRAEELYLIYDNILRNQNSKVTIRSILLEEKGHLQEMQEGLAALHNGFYYAQEISKIESYLCKMWLQAVLDNVALETVTKVVKNRIPSPGCRSDRDAT